MPQPMPRIAAPKPTSLEKLDAQITEGSKLIGSGFGNDHPTWRTWISVTGMILRKLFDTDEFERMFNDSFTATAGARHRPDDRQRYVNNLREIRAMAELCEVVIPHSMTGKIYGNRWRVVRKLGSGGQGTAYLVEDTQATGAVVHTAMKLPDRDDGLPRFRDEVTALRTLQPLGHPGIVKLIDSDVEGTEPYLVMEYCEGGSIVDSPKRWMGDLIGAVDICIQMCDALAAAHEKGIVHRDIKPPNILLRTDGGPVVIADFGLVRIAGADRNTLPNEVVGARKYMCPELRDGGQLNSSARCDLYSVGKVLYWLASGGEEFDREDHRLPGKDLSERHFGVAGYEMLNIVLDNLIARDPLKRYPTAADTQAVLAKLKEQIQRGARLLTPEAHQSCMFCRTGKYEAMHADPSGAAVYMGDIPGGAALRPMLVCSECGNVQMFRPDLINKLWWGAPITKRT